MRGGWLHRRLGEPLFAPELWSFSRPGIARGLALGCFLALTPTMGAQIILAAAAAFFLRVNIPVALAATLITNPLTAPFIYAAEYRLGVWLVGVSEPAEWEGFAGGLRELMRHGRPLWAGALVAGGALGGLAYALVSLLGGKAPEQVRSTSHDGAAPHPPPSSERR